jgi:hypothetical protein
VVVIDQSAALFRAGRFHRPALRGWVMIAAATGLVDFGGFAARGFSDNGLRLGSELVWRFTCLVYFAAIIAGPLARLIPSQTLRRICEERRQLVWGFCASYGVYLASILVPNALTQPAIDRDGLTAGMTVFALFGAGMTLIVAYTASRQAAAFLGDKARVAMLRVGMSTFWLAYALAGLAHISGPHRPDAFYGVSLGLMVAALLLRFADRFVAKLRAHRQAA